MTEKLGRFTLERRLGKGGSGEVWKAFDPDLQRYVALKVLLHSSQDDQERFLREARAAAGLGHPNIVGVHEVGTADGKNYIALEYIEGNSADIEAPSPRRSAEIVCEAAMAVHHAHKKGVVHRDLKPANILVHKDGRVLVTDFGLARRVKGESRLTVSGMVLGTPAYMPSEQALGEHDLVDERSDVYSLGATLYVLLTGKSPFGEGTAVEIMLRVIEGELRPPRSFNPRIHADLETIVLKAMEREREHRYQTAGELAEDLQRFLDNEPILARPPSIRKRVIRAVRKKLPVLIPILVLLVAFGIWGALTLLQGGRLKFVVTPDDARIEIDGMAVEGRSLDVASGFHVVRITAPDHIPVERPVRVDRNSTIEVAVNLKRETGYLKLEAEPPGTIVVIDGVPHGTPLPAKELPTGTYRLWAEQREHFRQSFEVTIRPGEITEHSLILRKAHTWIREYSDWPGHHVVGDQDGDGVPDLGNIYYGVDALIVSGADGRELVRGRISEQLASWGIWVDVDGDGLMDRAGAMQLGGKLGASLYNLKTKKHPWTRPDIPVALRPGSDTAYYLPLQRDLDGDGKADLVFIIRNELRAVRGYDGKDLWTAPTRELPTHFRWINVDKDAVKDLLVSGPGWWYAVSGKSGSVLWEREAPVQGQPWPVADSDELSYFDGNDLVYLSPETGKETRTVPAPEYRERGWVRANAHWRVMIDGPVVRFFDQKNGRRVWSSRLSFTPDHLYWLDVDGDAFTDFLLTHSETHQAGVVRGRDGKELWSFQGLGPIGVLSNTYAKDDGLMLSSGTRAIMHDRITGREIWSVELPAASSCAPVTCDYDGDGTNEIFLGTTRGHVVALNMEGREIFSTRVNPPIRSMSFFDSNRDGLQDVLAFTSGPVVIQSPRVLWRREMSNAVRGGPILHDVNEDGTPDVIVHVSLPQTRLGVAAFDGKTGRTLWQGGDRYDHPNPLTLADLTDDGRPEVIIWDVHGYIHGLDVRTGKSVRKLSVRSNGYASISKGDLDGDGLPELVASGWMNPPHLTVFSGRTHEALWAKEMTEPTWRYVRIADPEGTGKPDLFFAGVRGGVYRFDGRTGEQIWKAQAGGGNRAGVTIFPGNPNLALVPSMDGKLYVFDAKDGRGIAAYERMGGSYSTPLVEKLDGRNVVVSGSGGGVYCLDPAVPKILWSFRGDAGGEAIMSPPRIVDLNGDGAREVLVGSATGTLYCLAFTTGELLWRYRTARMITGEVAVADMDGDGVLDVVVTSHDKSITCVTGRGRLKKP